MWNFQIKYFNQLINCINLECGYTENLVDEATLLLKQIPKQCHLVGFSLGGNLALEMCHQQPTNIETLTLLSTGSLPMHNDEAQNLFSAALDKMQISSRHMMNLLSNVHSVFLI